MRPAGRRPGAAAASRPARPPARLLGAPVTQHAREHLQAYEAEDEEHKAAQEHHVQQRRDGAQHRDHQHLHERAEGGAAGLVRRSCGDSGPSAPRAPPCPQPLAPDDQMLHTAYQMLHVTAPAPALPRQPHHQAGTPRPHPPSHLHLLALHQPQRAQHAQRPHRRQVSHAAEAHIAQHHHSQVQQVPACTGGVGRHLLANWHHKARRQAGRWRLQAPGRRPAGTHRP
jgi:hypothetical protein